MADDWQPVELRAAHYQPGNKSASGNIRTAVLEQRWINTRTGAAEWRAVPSVHLPSKQEA